MKNRRPNVSRESGLYVALLTCVMAGVMSRPVLAGSEPTPPSQKTETQTELLDAFAELKSHIRGQAELDARQIEALKLTIDRGRDILDCDAAVINVQSGALVLCE